MDLVCALEETRVRQTNVPKVAGAMYKVLKRLLDIVASSAAIAFFSPILVLTSILVLLLLRWPILFKQKRPGMNGKPFTILKFRTMTDDRGPDGRLLPDGKRLTPFGRFLRGSSLDELPELFNVLFGQMSFVGPRPLIMAYLERYTPDQARRHEVKPGITGWAQVNGRNALTWEERLRLDVWYVDHKSLIVDFKILLRTVHVVLRREGISAEGHDTMPEFVGNGLEQKVP